jgi:uncharacterized protein YdaU (DUF1376 family)
MSAKADTWMPLYVADYQSDTSRLTLEQHGAYLLLIMDYWRNGPPPDDDDVLARILGVERRAWTRLRPAIARFFTVTDGEWRHGRIDRELEKAIERTNRSARGGTTRWGEEAAQERGRHMRSRRLSEARQLGTHSPEEWIALRAFCGPSCLRCGVTAEQVKDHILPIYKGGSDAIDNIQPLCRSCNASKGPEDTDLRPDGWKDAVANAVKNAFPAGVKRLADACPSPSPTPNGVISDANASSVPPKSRTRKRSYPAEFEVAWSAYPHYPGRSSKPDALKEWERLPDDERADLLQAIGMFKAKIREICGDKGAPCMGRWLKHGRHLSFGAVKAAGLSERAAAWGPETWGAAVRIFVQEGQWDEASVGPRPGQPGCHAPPEILRRHGIEPAALARIGAAA